MCYLSKLHLSAGERIKMKTDYWQEFKLNLENQITEDIEDIVQVGYSIDNAICFTILIPNNFLKEDIK